jgi:hypothetical protein
MSILQDRQFKFSSMFADLITWIGRQQGYQVKIGEVLRPSILAQLYAKMGIGIAQSKHLDACAGDIQIFKDGAYLTKTEDYKFAGDYWINMGGIWGGNFKSGRKDGGHFEV